MNRYKPAVVRTKPVCVYPGAAGRSDRSSEAPEPGPGERPESVQNQPIRRRGGAPEVLVFGSISIPLNVRTFLYIGLICVCRCCHLSAEWEELEEACSRRAAHLSKAVAREQVRESRYLHT